MNEVYGLYARILQEEQRADDALDRAERSAARATGNNVRPTEDYLTLVKNEKRAIEGYGFLIKWHITQYQRYGYAHIAVTALEDAREAASRAVLGADRAVRYADLAQTASAQIHPDTS